MICYSIPAAINIAVIIIVENRVIPAISIFVFNNCSFIQFGFIPVWYRRFNNSCSDFSWEKNWYERPFVNSYTERRKKVLKEKNIFTSFLNLFF